MLLECSLNNSRDKTSNAEWHNVFQSPVQINTGDVVQVKQAYLNTKQGEGFGDIVLEEDVDLTLNFGYFVYDYDVTNKQLNGQAYTTPTFKNYVMRDSNNDLIQGNIVMKIPAGSYTPDLLAKKMTEIGSQINVEAAHGQLSNFTTTRHQLLYSTQGGDTYKLNFNVPTNPLTAVKTLVASSLPIPNSIATQYANGQQITLHYQALIQPIRGVPHYVPNTVDAVVSSLDANAGILTLQTAVDMTNGDGEIEKVKQVYAVHKTQSTGVKFYEESNGNNYITFTNNTYVGSSQFEVVFENNRFSLVCHTPYFGTASSTPKVALQSYTVSNSVDAYALVDLQSGVFLTKADPQSFWTNTLGMNLDLVLVKDDTTNQRLETPLKRGRNISAAEFTIDAILNKTAGMTVPDPSTVSTIETETNDMTMVDGVQNYQTIADGGFFLIAIDGLPTQYVEDDKNRHNILAVCSRQYDANGFITFFGGDGTQLYVNSGEPFTLTGVKCSILDPLSKQPVASLGTGNAIFLEVLRKSS